MFISPYYRKRAMGFNMDDYASKGSSVHSVKKYNRAIQNDQQLAIEPGQSSALVLANNSGRLLYINSFVQ